MPLTGVRLGLAHPPTQRLAMNAEITRDVRDRSARLECQPHRALAQLVVVLAGTGHRQILDFLQDRPSWHQGLRQTQPGSGRVPSWRRSVGWTRGGLVFAWSFAGRPGPAATGRRTILLTGRAGRRPAMRSPAWRLGCVE